MGENKKKAAGGGFLRWPWNVVVYVLLVLVLRLFAVPVILVLVWLQNKNNPHGAAEGYCLSRTRKKASWILWGLLSLVIAVCLGSVFFVGLGQPMEEVMDYVTLAVSGGGAAGLGALGVYMCCVCVRDVFFPAKSGLACSIRSQLPYPEEAPPVEELFAMVDEDLKANAQWFGSVGIGREWVLGDLATRIDRIRGIFTIDEIHQHHTQTGTRTSRTLQLVLIDDRWQRHTTSFTQPQELKAAADCLALRVPEAARGAQYTDFWTMDESAREDFEREFRQKRNLRASEEALRGEPQDMILRRGGDVTSRVDPALVEEALERCLADGASFTLTPSRPIPRVDRQYRELRAERRDGRLFLTLIPVSASGGGEMGMGRSMEMSQAREVTALWLQGQVPDLAQWTLGRVYAPENLAPAAQPRQAADGKAKLYLVRANGLSETHTAFTEEDVAVAAEGLVDGSYQVVEVTQPEGYLWIRAGAGDQTDGRCTVEATRPDAGVLRFFRMKMTPRQAAAWVRGYPRGEFLPQGGDWQDFTKQVK